MDFFRHTTQDEFEAIRAVNRWANNSPNYESAAKNKFAGAADSFLIGHALPGGHTVVTHEKSSNSRGTIKIPNAAIANGVSHMNPFQMLRAEGVSFILSP